MKNSETLSVKKLENKPTKLSQPRRNIHEGYASSPKTKRLDMDVPPHSQIVETRTNSTSETEGEDIDSSPRELRDDSDWVPGSSYLQQKLQNDKTTDYIAYHLRSRLVSRSGRGADGVKAGAEMKDPSGNEHAQNNTSPDKTRPKSSHSYNLRSMIESASSVTQAK